MKVVCVRNNSKLVKGTIYDVLSISTLNNGNVKNFRPTIRVNVNGMTAFFSANNFRNTDGTALPEINWESPEYIRKKSDSSGMYIKDVSTLKKGDILICRYGTTLFEQGKMYKVDDIIDEVCKSPHGYSYKNQKIKIQGYNRWISHYRFRPLTAQEKRTISLGDIFGEENNIQDLSEVRKVRKFDRLSNKEKTKVLLNSLISSISDPSRNTLTIAQWAANKKAKGYGLKESDYKQLLNKKLSDIVKIFE